MSNWREAKSLLTLLAEYNKCFPARSKASDGMLGDAAHASRESDHNPWIDDGSGPNVVSAIDLTRSSWSGIPDTAQWLVDQLVKSRDSRVKYLIHNHRIWRSYDKPGIPAWSPAPYTGANAHEHHAHVSVKSDKPHYDSTAPWGLVTALNNNEEDPLMAYSKDDLKAAAKAGALAALQEPLVRDVNGDMVSVITALSRNERDTETGETKKAAKS